MTEGWTTTLPDGAGWRRIGSTPEKDAVEVVVRAFDADVLVAAGRTPDAPDAPPVTVRRGEGGRVVGLHVFVRPAAPGAPCRILVRGV